MFNQTLIFNKMKTTEQLDTMTVTKVITRNDFRTILEGVNNPDMISFVSKVPEKMNQYLDYWLIGEGGKKTKNPNPTVNPFFESGVYNLSRKYKIITGFDYVKSVNRRLEKEGKESNFVGGFQNPDREVWFEVISKGLVTDRKTHSKFYLRYQFCKDSVIGTPEHFYNGNPIEKQLFESYLTQKNTDSYSNQGLDDTLNFQVCNLDNIMFVSMGKEVYELID
jgi:hypothetical protein